MELGQKNIIERAADYYRGERISNALLIVIGGTAFFWTLFLYLWRQGHMSAGIFYSTLPFAGFLLISGLYRFVRSLDRYKRISDKDNGLHFLKIDEKEHLHGRYKRFKRKRQFDLFGILLGFFMIFIGVIFAMNHIFIGTAISITFASFILLVFDLFGQYRTEEFLHHLDKEYKKGADQ